MLHLHVVQAAVGDSLILEHRDQGSSRFVLIDGGPPHTYAKHLRSAIGEIVTGRGRLDLVVLTHVDNDHICGMIEFLRDIKNSRKQPRSHPIQPDGIWHNTFKQTVGIKSDIASRVLDLAQQAQRKGLFRLGGEAVRGYTEGEQTSELASDLGIPVNDGFPDRLILSETAPTPWSIEGLKLWIVGPDRHNLVRLQKEWHAWLDKKVSEPVRRAAPKDTSIPNLSSIMLLAEEAGGRQILLTGDGSGKEILAGLESIGKLDPSGRIHVDVLKLPHHGSERNVSKEFFDNVTANLYVVSAKGDNPALETLEWIVTSAKAQNRSIQILATNQTDSTEKLLQKYDQHTFGYTMTYMPAGEHYHTV